MSDYSSFPITLQHFQSASAADLLYRIKTWVEVHNSACLVHPHGFWVVLLRRTEFEDWRFHFWPKHVRNTAGMPAMIHTHDKVIESFVLLGELTNTLYNVDEVTFGGQPIYEVAYGGDKYRPSTVNVLQKTKKRAIASIKSEETLAGETRYRIKAHEYHSATVSIAASTATVICMHSHSPGPIRVLGLDGYPSRLEFLRPERQSRELLRLM